MTEVASRLFLSADLIGSTAKKQESESAWMEGLLAFYQQFPSVLADEVSRAMAVLREQREFDLECEPPKLWKAVGDELLYAVDVTHEKQVWVYVTAWKKSLVTMQDAVFRKFDANASGGALKGGAWMATFPFPDRRVGVPLGGPDYEPDANPESVNSYLLNIADTKGDPGKDEAPTPSVRVDYVGPSIDIGFRILKSASARCFPVSLEVAWALATVNKELDDGDPHCTIYYEGEVPMKGVWGGRGYPLFWLDTGQHHDAQPHLDKLANLRAIDPGEVVDLAKVLHASDWPCRIYLAGSDTVPFKTDKNELSEVDERISRRDDTSVDRAAFELEEE